MKEEVATNSASSGAIASLNTSDPSNPPVFKKKKPKLLKTILKRKPHA